MPWRAFSPTAGKRPCRRRHRAGRGPAPRLDKAEHSSSHARRHCRPDPHEVSLVNRLPGERTPVLARREDSRRLPVPPFEDGADRLATRGAHDLHQPRPQATRGSSLFGFLRHRSLLPLGDGHGSAVRAPRACGPVEGGGLVHVFQRVSAGRPMALRGCRLRRVDRLRSKRTTSRSLFEANDHAATRTAGAPAFRTRLSSDYRPYPNGTDDDLRRLATGTASGAQFAADSGAAEKLDVVRPAVAPHLEAAPGMGHGTFSRHRRERSRRRSTGGRGGRRLTPDRMAQVGSRGGYGEAGAPLRRSGTIMGLFLVAGTADVRTGMDRLRGKHRVHRHRAGGPSGISAG